MRNDALTASPAERPGGSPLAPASPTGIPYGYRIPRDERGLNKAGVRVIEPDEARRVVEIFQMFVSGMSPSAIARDLNARGIPGKAGGRWTDAMVRGHTQRGGGVLRNELYIGREVSGRRRITTGPSSGRETSHPKPETEWRVRERPELRIVPQDLWDRAQQRLAELGSSAAAQRARLQKIWIKRPPKHALDGLLKCGTCGRDLLPVERTNQVACGASRKARACERPTRAMLPVIEQMVFSALTNCLEGDDTEEALATFLANQRSERDRERRVRSALERSTQL